MNNMHDSDPNTVIRLDWNPTPKQFEAYKAREVELARKNLMLVSSNYFERTLHSADTIRLALRSPS